jgi:isopenicillin-N epimerase
VSETEVASLAPVRRELWTLDPQVVFLNHGSFGACPRPILESQARWRTRLERQPVQFMLRELEAALDASRAVLASFVGAQPEDIVWVPNATTGVNTVLRSLELRPQDELLLTDHQYAACRNAADFVAARTGARVVVAEVPFPCPGPETVVESVLSRTSPRTRLALLDHVTSPTGLVLPIEPLVAALDARGIPTLVDGAHAPGMLALDVERVGAAFYTGNCHKWVCAPKGAGFLWVRRDLQPLVRPLVTSHGVTSKRTDRSRFNLEFDWPGTFDPTPFLCVGEAIELMGSLLPGGWPALRRRNRDLALAGRALAGEALGIGPPAPPEMIGSLAALPLWDGAPETASSVLAGDPLQAELLRRHGLELPVFTWPAPPRRLVRLSAQAYNGIDDYRLLGRALREMREAASTRARV